MRADPDLRAAAPPNAPRADQSWDAVDFWRVEAVEPDRPLRLRAEMKLPGRAITRAAALRAA